jgi:hypothetical protein
VHEHCVLLWLVKAPTNPTVKVKQSQSCGVPRHVAPAACVDRKLWALMGQIKLKQAVVFSYLPLCARCC